MDETIDPQSTQELAEAVRENTAQLQQLIRQIQSTDQIQSTGDSSPTYHDGEDACDDALSTIEEHVRLQCENDSLLDRIRKLEEDIAILREQNSELADTRAREDVEQSVSDCGGTSPALSWEERKNQVMQQLENECFDSESFLSTLNSNSNLKNAQSGTIEDPVAYIESLNAKLDAMADLIRRYENENQEFHELILRDEAGDGAVTTASVVDSDAVIQEEREKLRQLQIEWEKRFHDAELEASLERAKLSRQRVEMQLKNEQLKEQLEALQRQTETQHESSAPESLMAKLGIAKNRRSKFTLDDQD